MGCPALACLRACCSVHLLRVAGVQHFLLTLMLCCRLSCLTCWRRCMVCRALACPRATSPHTNRTDTVTHGNMPHVCVLVLRAELPDLLEALHGVA
jgi:hypothetical protein